MEGIDGNSNPQGFGGTKGLEMLDSIIWILEIMADGELIESVRRAEEDVEAGRVSPLEEFLKELDEKEA